MPKQTPLTFPVCEHLREEIDARGWSLETFCERTGLRRDLAEEILSGHRRVTRMTAQCLGWAFGCSSEIFLRLQESHEKGGE